MPKIPTGIGWQGLIMTGLPLLLQLVFVLILELLIVQAKVKIESEYQSALIMDQAMSLSHEALNGSVCCFMMSMTPGSGLFGSGLDRIKLRATNDLDALRASARMLPELEPDLAKLENCYNAIAADWQHSLSNTQGALMANKLAHSKQLYNDLNAAVEDLIQASKSKVSHGSDTHAAAHQSVERLLIASAITWLTVSIGIAFLFSKNIASRINLLIENTQRFRHGNELLPPLSGTDEIAAYDHAFHKMADSIKASTEYKEQLLGVVSHEIRTSLSSAQAFLTNISAEIYGPLKASSRSKVQGAEREIVHIIKMVNDLIDIERLKSGQFPLQFKEVDLAFLIQEIIAAMKEQGITRPIIVRTQPALIEGDIKLLTRLIVNFIQDCLQSSSLNSTISINVFADHSKAIFTIDSASEISAPEEMFEIAGMSASHGISLALCKNIAEIHSGQTSSAKAESGERRLYLKLPLRAKTIA